MKSLYKNNGNAMAEFVVVAAILVPAVLAIPVLSKITDTNLASVQASRYSVWERTIFDSGDKSDAVITVEARNRFFAREDLFIETEDELLVGDDAKRTFWETIRTDDVQAESLISESGAAVVIVTRNESIPSGTGADILADGISAAGSAMDGMIPDAEWDLERRGFYIAEVTSEVGTNRLIGAGTDCGGVDSDTVAVCMQHRAALFTDSWDSGSPNQTEERVRALVPAGVFNQVGDVLSYVGAVPLFAELKHLKGIFGHVEADILPADRHGDPE